MKCTVASPPKPSEGLGTHSWTIFSIELSSYGGVNNFQQYPHAIKLAGFVVSISEHFGARAKQKPANFGKTLANKNQVLD